MFVYAKNTQHYREYWVARANVYLNEAATGHCSPVKSNQIKSDLFRHHISQKDESGVFTENC